MPAAAAPPASAEADEDTKSTRRGVHAKHTGPQLRREYADVELQSKYSHESVKEDKAKMHYSIRSRTEEVSQREANATKDRMKNLQQAKTLVMHEEQEPQTFWRHEPNKIGNNGSDSTVSVDTVNTVGAPTLEGQALTCDPGAEEALGSDNHNGKFRSSFTHCDDASSNGLLDGDVTKIGRNWLQGSASGGASIQPVRAQISGSRRQTVRRSGQQQGHPAIRPDMTTSRVDAVLNEVDTWTDVLKRRPVGDDFRPQSAMPSDHPTSRARGGYVAGSDYTADYSMDGASPSVPPEEEVEDELGAAAAAVVSAAATVEPASLQQPAIAPLFLETVQSKSGQAPIAVHSLAQVSAVKMSLQQSSGSERPKRRASRARSPYVAQSSARDKWGNGTSAKKTNGNTEKLVPGALKRLPYAASVLSPSERKNTPKGIFVGSMQGQSIMNESPAAIFGKTAIQVVPSGLRIDVGDAWTDRGSVPATFEEVPAGFADSASDTRAEGEIFMLSKSRGDENRSIDSLTPIAAHSAIERQSMQLASRPRETNNEFCSSGRGQNEHGESRGCN